MRRNRFTAILIPVRRLKLPVDWLAFAAIMGWIYGLVFLAYGLFTWYNAAHAGNPAAFAEVPRGVWIAGWSGLGLAPGLALLAFIFRVQWVRIQGGVSDPFLFGRFPLAESGAQPNDLRSFQRLGDAALPSDPLKRIWLFFFLALPPTGAALFRFLDWNPLGTVMIFGAEEGRLELIIIGIGLFCILLAVISAVARVNRLQ